MRPVKAFQLGRVEIVVRIGMLVMMPVMGGPPESSFLGGGATEESEEELERTAGLVTPVGKIAVKGTGDSKLTGEKHERAKHGGLPVDSSPKDGEARDVKQDEKNAGKRNIDTSMHM